MLNVKQLRARIVRPALRAVDLWSQEAEDLVLGTALKESVVSDRNQAIVQIPNGPALGLWQMEPATHRDLWDRFLPSVPKLHGAVSRLLAPSPSREEQLVSNLMYAAAMCRVHYRRVSAPLPTDLAGMAAYWKRYYNTIHGKGKPEEFVTAYRTWAG